MNSSLDTISAIATAPGIGAIGVVRVSGPDSFSILSSVISCAPLPAERVAALRGLYSGDGKLLDTALVTVFRGPHSYTGEDTVELSCHGGIAVLRAVLQATINAGARPADPGEFTRRAYINGRLDLAQAEAVNQIIRSRTAAQLAAANLTAQGALSDRIRQASGMLTYIAAALEACIDFPEDVDEPEQDQLLASLQNVSTALSEITELARRGQTLAEGIRLAIIGPPNAGKSSLLNLLAGRNRAIVSDIPGTTRDFLEEATQIGGLPVTAIDTAGIRKTDDPIEQEGTRRAIDTVAQADVILLVLDASHPQIPVELKDVLNDASEKCILVWNKSDLVNLTTTDMLPACSDIPAVLVSALSGNGLADLELAVLGRIGAGAGYFDEALAASERQVASLVAAQQFVSEAIISAANPAGIDLAAIHVQAARLRLAEITGESVIESLIDSIFSSFCIGK